MVSNSTALLLCLSAVLLLSVRVEAGGLDVLSDFQGIPYTNEGSAVGLPMGGIGAGCVEITSKGTLIEFAHLNNWADRIPSIAGTGLYLTYRDGANTQVIPLAERKIAFEGNFPFAKLTFTDLPVKLTLWCWSPFIFHDARHSAYPIAVFDAQITNAGNAKAGVGLAISYGTDYGNWTKELLPGDMKDIPVSIESGGSVYSGKSVNGLALKTKASADESTLAERGKEIKSTYESICLRSYDYVPVDVSGACNRDYLHDPFNDTNPKLCFSDLKPGPRKVYDVPFDVVDGAANGGRSCVIAGPQSGAMTVDIPIDRKADCLFFLGNVAAWAGDGFAKYVIRYSDGTSTTVPLTPGKQICDWAGGSASHSLARITGSNGSSGEYIVNLFAIPTDGAKTIQSVAVEKTGRTSPVILAITTGRLSNTPMPADLLNARRADADRIVRSLIGGLDGAKLLTNADADLTLSAIARKGASVFTYVASGPEGIATAIENGRSMQEPNASVYAVEQRISLAPGKSGTVGLLLSWYASSHYNTDGRRFGHMYENWFKGPSDVAEEVARDHDSLLAETKHSYDLIATSTLPKWYREMVQSNFYMLPSTTWWTKDGISFTYETPNGCPVFGTMDVSYYGSFTVLAAFPELYAQVLRQYCGAQTVDGYIPHNTGISNGLVDTFTFPSGQAAEAPRPGSASYKGYRADTNVKFCLEIYRQYQWTGDKEFVKEVWPNLKRAMAWVYNLDDDNDGLPEVNYGYDSWQMTNKVEYISNQWIICLKAVAILARMMGEPDYAAKLDATREKALAQFERCFWNGKYFRQGLVSETEKDEMVSALQGAGSWYASVLGLDDGIPREQLRSGLKTIHAVNGKDAIYGVSVVIHPDGKRSDSWQQFICDTGWALFFGSQCMYEGLDDIGLSMADEIWRQFTVEKARLPWCQPNVIQQPWNPDSDSWLNRDMRQGVTITLAYAAAGLRMDIPAQTASITPADWIWREKRFVLPVTMPKWLGQVKCSRKAGEEIYTITNESSRIDLKSLKLRTDLKGQVSIDMDGRRRSATVLTDGTVDVGRVRLGKKPVNIKMAAE